MATSITDKIIFGIGIVLYFSDLLFPVWLVGIIIFSRKKGWELWKGWCLASTFCLSQAYIVAKFIGYNVGAYTLIWFGSQISSLFYDLPPSTPVTKYLTPFQLALEMWVAPPVAIIIMPTFVLFLISKLAKRKNCEGNQLKIKKNAQQGT